MSERYILRHGETLYRVTAASASLATVEVLAYIGDPSIWRGEIEAWNEAYYRERYGDPDDVVDIPDTRDLTAAECEAASPTSRTLLGEFGPQLWVLPDGDAVAGMPRPGRYVRRELRPGEPLPCPYWEREGKP